MKSIIDFSHQILEDIITKENVTIDFTVGNGNDTFFLVKISKFVYGFDIQEQACYIAKKRLKDYNNYMIINDNHINFLNYINESFKGAIFNLGYLPKGNKDVFTSAETTLKTIELVLKNISIGGICVIVIYPGHLEGLKESILLNNYLSKLDQKIYDVLKYEFINQINNPPYLIAVRRKK